ncbi:MAG: hypothetical protein IT315_10265 [Anaerolineales bacterium]|nr:hypothetical protein [Anaerolineales bacterium]
MAKKPARFTLDEIYSDQVADLESAQRAALDALALDVSQTIRDLLASGRLVQVNGKIIPNPNR